MRNMFIAFIILLVIVLFLGCSLEAAKKNTVEKPINDVKTSSVDKGIKEEPKQESVAKETPKETRKTIAKSGRTPQLVEELEGNETLQVHFLNVGHGDSILVIAPNGGTMLIDGGYEDQPRIIMKYLEDLGINYLDVMLLTHAHDDHVGGLDLILKKLGYVYRVYDSGYPPVNNTRSDEYESYKSFLKIAERKNYEVLRENMQILIDENVLVEFFAPYQDGFFESLNDDSIVTRIDYGDVSFLLTGDCEFECEKKIMVNDVDVDILKVAHHGADDATSVQFLEKVSPQLAIISTGEYEKFHHPGQGVLDRLKNIKTMRTDIEGNIVVETDGRDFRVFIKEPVQLQEFDYT